MNNKSPKNNDEKLIDMIIEETEKTKVIETHAEKTKDVETHTEKIKDVEERKK